MRDRLADIIDSFFGCYSAYFDIDKYELADHLLANGVIVPPCKVGDSIFRVGNGEIWEWLIEHIEIYEDESGLIDDSDNWCSFEDIGKTVFLTKEEAEQALKEREGL